VSAAHKALVDLLHGERPSLLEAAYGPGEHPDRERDADALLALHAHELAEKIRFQDPVEAALAGQDAWRTAADLIDPEVSNDG
jgi:uncharacterized caspase-like protein